MQDARPPLPDDIATLQQMVGELLATVAELRTTVEKQQAHIHYLVRMQFGRRSERLEGPTLFDDHPAPVPVPVPSKPEVVEAVKRPGHGRRPQRALEHRQQVIDVSEAEKLCPCCGAARVCIGRDTRKFREYEPPKHYLQEIIRPTYICRGCEQNGRSIQAIQAPLPPEPIPGGMCGPGLLAHLIVSKYVDHLPLYRLESILGRQGWSVSRSTLCDQIMACAGVLTPLYQLMCQRVKASFALHTDDTPVPLLNPRRTASAWVYVGDASHPYIVFDLSDGHRQEFPEKFLKGYQGFVQADGYTGYNPIYAGGASHVGCWMHVRRYFFEAKDSDAAKSHEALARIRTLYAVERDARAKNLTGVELAAYRCEHAGPLVNAFAEWLAEEVPKALPKSKIGEAFIYASHQWPTLTQYLADGRLRIDNSPAEQAIRPLAVGRRNWLHIAGHGGLASAAVLLSVTASAKRHAVNPWDYIQHILTQLPARSTGADLSDLLPDVWTQSIIPS